jgi:glycosyltransferase involved in cell wall biosynthesis
MMIMREISTTVKAKILWLTENYPPQRGGMSVSCDRLVRNLRRMDFEVDVAHFSPRHLKWKAEKKIGGRQFACPARSDVAHTLNRFWNLIETTGYSHVVAFGGLLPMKSAPVFAGWLDCRLVTMIRGNDFDTGIFSLKRGDILHRSLENSDAICAVSRDKVEKISKLYPGKKVYWTPNGIDLDDWEFSDEDRRFAATWRAENQVTDKKVIGLFGQLKRKKGGLFFLENLVRSGVAEKFHLLFVGDMEKEMHSWLEETGDQISSTALPFLDRYELLPFYAACDFIAVPSFYDGMPNVLLESAGLKIPTISSNTGGMRDILNDGENSITFQAGDDFDCQRAIREASQINGETFSVLQNNIYQTAVKFNPQREIESYAEIFTTTEISKKGAVNA